LALLDVNDRTASDSFDMIDKTHLRVVALAAATAGDALPPYPCLLVRIRRRRMVGARSRSRSGHRQHDPCDGAGAGIVGELQLGAERAGVGASDRQAETHAAAAFARAGPEALRTVLEELDGKPGPSSRTSSAPLSTRRMTAGRHGAPLSSRLST
jgi:hypothetical protein